MKDQKQPDYRKEIESLIESSRQNLADAQKLLETGGYRSAISRAYYAFLGLAKAALLTKGIMTQTQDGAVTKFGQVFVKTNIIKGNYGRSFNRALESRLEADYEIFRNFTTEEVETVIKEAQSFLKELDEKIFSQ